MVIYWFSASGEKGNNSDSFCIRLSFDFRIIMMIAFAEGERDGNLGYVADNHFFLPIK